MKTESETVTGPIANPPHPGELVRFDCLKPLNLTVTAGAKALAWRENARQPRQRAAPACRPRWQSAFGDTPQVWINMQAAYNYAQVAKRAGAIRATVQPVHNLASGKRS